jgi:acetyl-CoA carboxylase biotin carboxylase subunit
VKKVLVANRGEIAVRIIRAVRELGMKAVAIHSTADASSRHVAIADEAICIGPPAASESYLNVPMIMSALEVSGADAVHPGYGFLAENARFAEIAEDHGITFVGPTPDQIRRMGDKAVARSAMREAGVPIVPGSEGIIDTADEARSVAAEIGFPVIIKAKDGGGGKGMRVVQDPAGIETAFAMARAEAEAAFGSGAVYLERFIQNPRHVEIQLLGDGRGEVVHLFERDCSIQRRHQKLLEEAPSPAVDEALRVRMGSAAVEGARAINYRGAGTMEFLLTPDGEFFFMEMNTRLQVEHPVTEFVTGIDLVHAQLRVAAGEGLGVTQDDIRLTGHAIECRINAEDPDIDFRPSPGRVRQLILPGGPGVRVDTHVYPGYEIPPFYDSLIGKLIVHGATRDEAIARLSRALDEFVVEGIPTTVGFHRRVVRDERFRSGRFDTSFLEGMVSAIRTAPQPV